MILNSFAKCLSKRDREALNSATRSLIANPKTFLDNKTFNEFQDWLYYNGGGDRALSPLTLRVFSIVADKLGPYTTDTLYADNAPYLSTNTVAILFKRVQDHSFLVNFSDWSVVTEAIKKDNAIFRLITPPSFDDIDLTPNEMLFNKYIDMFEFRGAVKEKEN